MKTVLVKCFFLALCLLHPCLAQDESKFESPQNLADLVEKAGFGRRDISYGDFYDFIVFQNYIRYGNQFAQYRDGDQFDRMEIMKTAKTHRAKLRTMRLFLDKMSVFVEDIADLETKGRIVNVRLPFRIWSDKEFRYDRNSYSGIVSMMHCSEISEEFAFLTKDGTLRPCTLQDAYRVKRMGGAVYVKEASNTTLMLVLNGEPNMPVADKFTPLTDYTAEIEFTELSLQRPYTFGYFSKDAYFDADRDCRFLRSTDLYDDSQPAYFITAVNDERKIPELVHAKLTLLRLVDKAGKIVGGYNLPQSQRTPAPATPPPSVSGNRFSKSADGVILDSKTGLLWYVGYSDFNHFAAEKFAKSLTANGGGWRLPTIEELWGIWQPRHGECHIDPIFGFRQTSANWYPCIWTSVLSESGYAAFVYFRNKNLHLAERRCSSPMHSLSGGEGRTPSTDWASSSLWTLAVRPSGRP